MKKKWVIPTVEAINIVGENVLTDFLSKFNAIKQKYSNPLSELSDKIKHTDTLLKTNMNELTGNDIDMTAISLLLEEL